jgi:hypothetical protein
MAIDPERQSRAAALIPDGPPPAQAIFRKATCLAYARGLTIQNAVNFGIEQAREKDPDFTPIYNVAIVTLESI